MKTRSSFVSNSSSSSFVCDVCGEVRGGYDFSISDAYMYRCSRGHTFCEDEALDIDTENFRDLIAEYKEVLLERLAQFHKRGDVYRANEAEDILLYLDHVERPSEFCEILFEDAHNVDSFACPVCRMEVITDDDALNYMLWSCGKTLAQVKSEMKTTFSSYDAMMDHIG